jgi:hypothetical protein
MCTISDSEKGIELSESSVASVEGPEGDTGYYLHHSVGHHHHRLSKTLTYFHSMCPCSSLFFCVILTASQGMPQNFSLPHIVLEESWQIPGRFLVDSWQIPGRALVFLVDVTSWEGGCQDSW